MTKWSEEEPRSPRPQLTEDYKEFERKSRLRVSEMDRHRRIGYRDPTPPSEPKKEKADD